MLKAKLAVEAGAPGRAGHFAAMLEVHAEIYAWKEQLLEQAVHL